MIFDDKLAILDRRHLADVRERESRHLFDCPACGLRAPFFDELGYGVPHAQAVAHAASMLTTRLAAAVAEPSAFGGLGGAQPGSAATPSTKTQGGPNASPNRRAVIGRPTMTISGRAPNAFHTGLVLPRAMLASGLTKSSRVQTETGAPDDPDFEHSMLSIELASS